MANFQDPVWLVGRRFETDFTVLSIDAGRTVTISMRGTLYKISWEELQTLIGRGFVVESDRTGRPGWRARG